MTKSTIATSLVAVSIATFAIQPLVVRADSSPAFGQGPTNAVYVATNDPFNNRIVAYRRKADGSLKLVSTIDTGGRGSGGTVDPLQSQNSLLISENHKNLYAVNAGSGDISVFDIETDDSLKLIDVEPSGGAFPVSLSQHNNTLYVLNASGGSNVTGFCIGRDGKIWPNDNVFTFLSGANIGGSSISVSPDGSNVVAVERGTNMLDLFPVGFGGELGAPTYTMSSGKVAFSATITSQGILLLSEAGTGSVSSYTITTGAIHEVTSSLSTGYGATCWITASADGKYAYAADSGSSEISVFSVAANGVLTLLGASASHSGSIPLDLSLSPDGKFLYALTVGEGSISVYSVTNNGGLTFLGAIKSIAAKSGQNGIAVL